MLSITISYAQSSNSLCYFNSSVLLSCSKPNKILKNNLTRSSSFPTSASIQPLGCDVGTLCYGCRGNDLSHSTVLIYFLASWYVSFFLTTSNLYGGSTTLWIHGGWLTSDVDASCPIHTPPFVRTKAFRIYFPLCSTLTIYTFPPLFSFHLATNCG